MERTTFNYSTKNIPLASVNDYTKRMIEKTKEFLCRMRWKAFHFLSPVTAADKKLLALKQRTARPSLKR